MVDKDTNLLRAQMEKAGLLPLEMHWVLDMAQQMCARNSMFAHGVLRPHARGGKLSPTGVFSGTRVAATMTVVRPDAGTTYTARMVITIGRGKVRGRWTAVEAVRQAGAA